MSTDRIQRVLPLSGALFAGVLAAGLALTSGEPGDGASRAATFAYWHGHHGLQLITCLLLIPFAVLFLLVFVAELRRVLRSGEAGEAIYSPIVLGGGFVAAAGLAVTGSLGAAVATAAHHNDQSATYALAQLQSYDWVPWMAGFAVMLLGCGVGGLRTRALPKWVAVAAVVLGVAFLTPVGFFGLFLLPAWMLLMSIVLYRRQRPSVGRVVAEPVHAS